MNRKVRYFAGLFLMCLTCGQSALAQNPIVRDQFSADPTARVFEGKIYLYPSHDIPAPAEFPRKDWFCMADYHVFSSENLTDWKDHGIIVDQKDVPWGNPKGYSMWAPDCVYKDGKYYFYFPGAPADTAMRGFGLGVATSDHPYGPFVVDPQPIKGAFGIDPCVLLDKDGQAYLYMGAGGIMVGKLKADMKTMDGRMQRVENLPKGGLIEGPFAFEHNGWYYLTYPFVKEKTETLAYSMGKSPMGPFEYKGLIMDESPTGCWTNHHSIVEYKGQWYLFYHHNDYSPNFDKNRSVRIDKLSFNEDGTIQKVTPTLRGVGISDATKKIQIDRYSDKGEGTAINFLDTTNRFLGWKTIFAKANDWISYNDVDFGSKSPKSVTVLASSAEDAVLEIRLDGAKGKVLAQVKVAKGSAMKEYKAELKNFQKGVHNLYVVLKNGKSLEIDWVRFGEPTIASISNAKCRNLLKEAGYSQKAIKAKLDSAYYLVFEGPNKVYFEVGDSMAYVSDVKNHDVRTEGMSYGLMVAVQLDKKDVFDRLWRWSKKYMQNHGGPRDGYFGWSCKTTGEMNSAGSASDGEFYFITSLLFASNRWGDNTGINYKAEAQYILNAMFSKKGEKGMANIINEKEKLITFTPDNYGSRFTDPSYHLPVFYEIWAKYADDGRSDFWLECAQKSREYLHKATHPVTGLNPDYSNYDGTVMKPFRGDWGTKFRFDSWRVPMNIALDYTWSGGADAEWQQGYGKRIQAFFRKEGVHTFVDQYNIEGTPVENVAEAGGYKVLRHSLGLVAAVAAASLTQPSVDECRDFLDEFWNSKLQPYPDGYYDGYYDGLLNLFAWMHLSGNYKCINK